MRLNNKENKEIKPLPFAVYFWTVFIIAAAGLLDSIYLSISHYRVYTDIGYRSFCSISKSVNCDTVSQSIYSIFLGVPVPVWGIIGYLFFIVILFFAYRREAEKKRVWALLFLISFVYSIYSIILAYISAFYIHSYCFMCIVSHGINFLLVFFTWLVRNRFEDISIFNSLKEDKEYIWTNKTIFISTFVVILISSSLLIAIFPRYWDMEPPEISREISTGITKEGHPWIGAENPEIEVIEFTDYMCFQCKKMHFFLRQLINKHPKKIRLIHRHFPMDHQVNPFIKKPYHIGTGGMALFAIYANTKDKFWVMNDILFSIEKGKKKINLKKVAKLSGLDFKGLSSSVNDQKIRHKLYVDIMDGLKNGIAGTPSYIINGQVYSGQIPPDIINS
ncbi:MAG: thioredoxin domain-containing protein, partial [Deltaproteobacteria bacterium]|nr:thioredoxin domain-containing protein [Deltaproteobacteria bacterium]